MKEIFKKLDEALDQATLELRESQVDLEQVQKRQEEIENQIAELEKEKFDLIDQKIKIQKKIDFLHDLIDQIDEIPMTP